MRRRRECSERESLQAAWNALRPEGASFRGWNARQPTIWICELQRASISGWMMLICRRWWRFTLAFGVRFRSWGNHFGMVTKMNRSSVLSCIILSSIFWFLLLSLNAVASWVWQHRCKKNNAEWRKKCYLCSIALKCIARLLLFFSKLSDSFGLFVCSQHCVSKCFSLKM